jgi:hypothetical protein
MTGENCWLGKHIATCPRCQRRITDFNRVALAFSLLKTQPHSLDLLMKANTQAVNSLNHKLRTSTKADTLKQMRPEPGWLSVNGKYLQPLINLAACLAFVLLLKIGVFSSMEDFKESGETAVQNYYASRLDEQTYDDIFTA